MKDDALSSVFGGDQVRRDQVQRILQGESRLSRMARDMPSILSFVLDHLENLPAEARGAVGEEHTRILADGPCWCCLDYDIINA
jgi:hypothetical protein